MISFISGNLLKDEPCCKFMLKHDIKNGFRQSTRTLSIFFQLNTTQAELVIKNYF